MFLQFLAKKPLFRVKKCSYSFSRHFQDWVSHRAETRQPGARNPRITQDFYSRSEKKEKQKIEFETLKKRKKLAKN